VGDEIDFCSRRFIDFAKHLATPFGHHDEPSRKRDQAIHNSALIDVGCLEDGVKRCDNGHSQFAQQRQNVSARRASVNAELMLDTDDVYIADVEKIRCSKIGGQVLFFNLEADDVGIFVASRNVVYRNRKALTLRIRAGHCRKQVRRESCDAALSW